MQLFRIRFIASKDFVSSAIRGVTHSMWSHAEIVCQDGAYLGAHIDGGVQVRPFNYCEVAREKRYAIPVTDDQFNRAMNFARSQVGKPYDERDIVGIAVGENWSEPDSWICSQLVAAAAEEGSFPMLNVLPSWTPLVTPEMLHLSPLLIDNCYYSFGT